MYFLVLVFLYFTPIPLELLLFSLRVVGCRYPLSSILYLVCYLHGYLPLFDHL